MTKASEILNAIINGSENNTLSLSSLRTIENTALLMIHEKGGKSYSEETMEGLEK